MRKGFKKKAAAVLMAAAVLCTPVCADMAGYAQGPTNTTTQETNYTKEK